MMSARLFIRNDDVWTLDREFRFFFDQAVERCIPVVHAVIPGKMDQGLLRFLCRAKEKTPQLLDIVQHGWMHTNHSDKAGIKYEFGASRSLKSQRDEIRQGLKKMRLGFGELFTPAFVPPYHGYDERTLRVLHEEGFKIFSAGTRRSAAKKRFIHAPAQISFSRYEQNKVSINKAREVVTDLVKNVDHRPLSGVLTHHKDFAGVSLRREITRFFDYVAALKAKEGWRVLLFSEILSVSK
jgi:hypothetical protein